MLITVLVLNDMVQRRCR